jgi:predicted phage terminase large subunit-like protein
MEFPQLKRKIKEHAAMHGAHNVIIEDMVSGTSLYQQLRNESLPGLSAYRPKGDKIMRMNNQTALMEAGRVHVPNQAHWLEDYLHELAVFPNGKHDDQVDSTSQALDWIGATPVKGAAYLEIARMENAENDRLRYGENYDSSGVSKPEYAKGSMEWRAEQVVLLEEAIIEARDRRATEYQERLANGWVDTGPKPGTNEWNVLEASADDAVRARVGKELGLIG